MPLIRTKNRQEVFEKRIIFKISFQIFIFIFFSQQFIIAENLPNYSWKNLNFGGGGFVSGIITSKTEKNLIYARTDVGGAYRWVEATKSWKPLIDWASKDEFTYMGIESIAIDPSSPNKVYMSAGLYFAAPSAILRSNDYGETFQKTIVDFQVNGNGNGRNNGERLAVDPKNGQIIFCGSRDNGLWQSADGGVSWTNNASFPVPFTDNRNGVTFVVFDDQSALKNNATQRIFVGVSQSNTSNLYVTEDGGVSWSAVANQPTTNLMPQRVTKAGSFLYITYANAEGPSNPTIGAVYRYNISTSEWKNISPATLPFSGITVDASNSLKIMVSTINIYQKQLWDGGTVYGDNIYRSIDGGATWTNLCINNHLTADISKNPWIGTAPQLHWVSSIEIDPFNTERVLLTSGNGLFMSENISATKSTWAFQVDGLEETVPLDIISIPNGPTVTVVADYNGYVHSDPAVAPATYLKSGMGSTTGIDFAENNTQLGVVAGNLNCKYTQNGGITWTAMYSLPVAKASKGSVAISADGATMFWYPTGGANTYYTKDLGVTWKPILADVALKNRPVADKINPNKVYVAQSNNLYECVWNSSTSSYTYTNTVISSVNSTIRTIPGIEGDVWLPCSFNGLIHYTNVSGIKTTTAISSIKTCDAIGFGKSAPGKTYPALYLSGTHQNGIYGLYRSDDQGASWVRINDNNHQFGGLGDGTFIIGDRNIYGRVYVSTSGRGVIYGDDLSTTGVINPTEKSAFQLYPNPCTSLLIVKGDFSLIEIFTLNGLKVLDSTKTTVNVNNLANGCYIAKIHTLQQTFNQLFVKN